MKKIINIAMVCILFCSCQKNKKNIDVQMKDAITLELITKEMYFVAIDSNLLTQKRGYEFNEPKKYNDIERVKAENIVTYKITNHSQQKYCFSIDTNSFQYFTNLDMNVNSCKNDSISIRRMCYFVDDKINHEIKVQSVLITPPENGAMTSFKQEYYNILGNFNKSRIVDLEYLLTTENLIFINPGEYKIFKAKLSLPIDLEKQNSFSSNFHTLLLDPKANYNFRLGIYSKRNFITENLPKYKQKEIKDNGYEIFDGFITSNSVPLKSKK
jgi:hypothetical protein